MSLQIVLVQNNELLIINHYWLSKPVKKNLKTIALSNKYTDFKK